MIHSDRERIRAARLSDEDLSRGGRFEIRRLLAPGRYDAPPVPILLCSPATSAGPHATIYSIHGGGMVAGTCNSVELIGELERAEALDLAVASVEYRVAPENPDPAPVEDCYAGCVWLAEQGGDLGIDTERIVVSGASAGGGLAAGVSLLARDRGGPRLAGQMLLCPMLDDRCATPSSIQLDGVAIWDRTSNLTGWTALLGARRGASDVSCYAAPVRAQDLSGLPPAYIEVGEVESLRDEAVDYAVRISRAGGQAELHVWGGAFHSFDEWVPSATVSQLAKSVRIGWLRRVLSIS
jgi:acetyl esterase/lipase